MKRADKLPTIDPRTPNVYRAIVDTARAVRTRQQMDAALDWAERRAKQVDALQAVRRREAE